MSIEELPPVEQEREAVAVGAIVRIAIGTVVVIVLAVIVSDRVLRSDSMKAPSAIRPSTAVAPRVIGIVDQTLTSRPGVGLVQKDDEKRALGRYAWVDRAHGTVRIPIDRAISLYVAGQTKDSDAGASP